MDYKYIEQLLERYWRCETSLQEEEILRMFFSQEDIPVALVPYRSLFVYEQNEKEMDVLGDDFDQRGPRTNTGRRASKGTCNNQCATVLCHSSRQLLW